MISFQYTVTRWLIKSLAGLLAAAVIGAGLWTWGALNYVYAKGERAGFVQKFSKKGWVIKTWEGDLAMVNLPGVAPEIFPFTVRDERVAAEINTLMGRRVSLSYEQHRALPGRIFGDTGYFVTGVRAVEPVETPR